MMTITVKYTNRVRYKNRKEVGEDGKGGGVVASGITFVYRTLGI